MTAERVHEILDRLAAAGIEAVVDGGWGVDALLGRQTRPHQDLDLVVGLDAVPRIREALGAWGFELVEDHLPVRFVLAHPEIGQIDFHTVTWDAEGGGVQPQPGGGTFRYPPEGFTEGSVGSRAVRCISTEVQLLCHVGYEPGPVDAHDVLLLHRRFGVELGLELPAVYRRFLKAGE